MLFLFLLLFASHYSQQNIKNNKCLSLVVTGLLMCIFSAMLLARFVFGKSAAQAPREQGQRSTIRRIVGE